MDAADALCPGLKTRNLPPYFLNNAKRAQRTPTAEKDVASMSHIEYRMTEAARKVLRCASFRLQRPKVRL